MQCSSFPIAKHKTIADFLVKVLGFAVGIHTLATGRVSHNKGPKTVDLGQPDCSILLTPHSPSRVRAGGGGVLYARVVFNTGGFSLDSVVGAPLGD